MGIVRFALKFPYTFYVLAAFIVFLGVSAIWVMPEDIFPEINIPVVSVIWQYTGLSVPEMEGGVMLTMVGRDFFPAIDGGQIKLHVRAPAATRIEATERIFDDVEAKIREVIPA